MPGPDGRSGIAGYGRISVGNNCVPEVDSPVGPFAWRVILDSASKIECKVVFPMFEFAEAVWPTAMHEARTRFGKYRDSVP